MKFETIFTTNKGHLIVKRIKKLNFKTVKQLVDSVNIFKDMLDDYYTQLYVNRHKISLEYMRVYYDTLNIRDNDERDRKLDALWSDLINEAVILRKLKEYYKVEKIWIYDSQDILRNLGVLKNTFFRTLVPLRRTIGTIDKYDVARDLESMYLKYDEAKKDYIKAIDLLKKYRGG